VIRHRLLSAYQRYRIAKFRFLSDCPNVQGKPTIFQPVQLAGRGTIRFKGSVKLGCYPSAYFLSGYIYIEARTPDAIIEIGDGVWMNNNVALVSDGAGIFIGNRTKLGTHVEIIDSDFHDSHPDRHDKPGRSARVEIGENVLIGPNVRILKGVHIGNNCIIANGSVITRSVPDNMLVFGNPGRHGFGLFQE
jgi:acetyltransferase-like isoleucine patch superfamily enzyme